MNNGRNFRTWIFPFVQFIFSFYSLTFTTDSIHFVPKCNFLGWLASTLFSLFSKNSSHSAIHSFIRLTRGYIPHAGFLHKSVYTFVITVCVPCQTYFTYTNPKSKYLPQIQFLWWALFIKRPASLPSHLLSVQRHIISLIQQQTQHQCFLLAYCL